jgi:hypothetical protein
MSNFIKTESNESNDFKKEDLITLQFYVVMLRNLTEKLDECSSYCSNFIKINIFGNITDFLHIILDKYDE